jgi:hypothetical protein
MEGVIELIDRLLFSMARFISKCLKSTEVDRDCLPVDKIIRILKIFLLVLIITSIFMPCLIPFLLIPVIITIMLIIYLKKKR